MWEMLIVSAGGSEALVQASLTRVGFILADLCSQELDPAVWFINDLPK